jgi:DNA topoisomerase-1
MNLVIVESPTKAKTITKFLGKEYKLESSFGHIRDLPKSTMGIDTENDFTPTYIIPEDKEKNLNILKKLAKTAENIILATDEDREGEAIAWHLAEALEIPEEKRKRIAFHEITKSAILEALKHPRKIDMEMVNAQQARRILDRLVGYELSPFLWKKVARGLSAGRVQSVAVRLVVEREREIKAFIVDEYWTIDALLENTKKEAITARLNKINGKTVDKLEIKTKEDSEKILETLSKSQYEISNVEKKKAIKNAPKPFTTSTLQQGANRSLGFSAKQTMMLAQKLYEAGHITYMRTDSLNLSEKFLSETRIYLKTNVGEKYSLAQPRIFKTKSKGAQEAHEAIRPTDPNQTPELLKLEEKQQKLYRLIWQRTLASQMPEAIFDATTIDISAQNTPYEFRASGQVMQFDGYLKIYPESSKELDLPKVSVNEILKLNELKPEQHFTKPPARYSDAGLVKKMEEYGIGRPSTYAPTIATIEARNYVARDDNKKLEPTDIAFVVTDMLVNHFHDIVDYRFTAQMEYDLDRISEGKIEWQPIIKDFYKPFHRNLEEKSENLSRDEISPAEESEEVCDKCGEKMIIKTGRYGRFLACSNYPKCKNIKGLDKKPSTTANPEVNEKIKEMQEKYKDEKCEKCGEAMTVKTGRFGPFLACTGYPKCKNIKNTKEGNSGTGVTCPKCGTGEIVAKKSARGIFYACNQYPDCKNAYYGKPTGEKCPDCEGLLIEWKEGTVKCSTKGCKFKK